jgi:hypothetical protein
MQAALSPLGGSAWYVRKTARQHRRARTLTGMRMRLVRISIRGVTDFCQALSLPMGSRPIMPGSRRIAMQERIDEKIEMNTTKIDYKGYVYGFPHMN